VSPNNQAVKFIVTVVTRSVLPFARNKRTPLSDTLSLREHNISEPFSTTALNYDFSCIELRNIHCLKKSEIVITDLVLTRKAGRFPDFVDIDAKPAVLICGGIKWQDRKVHGICDLKFKST